MTVGYKVNKPVGTGSFIEVHNFNTLNEVGHYRFNIRLKSYSTFIIGIWKIKNK